MIHVFRVVFAIERWIHNDPVKVASGNGLKEIGG